MLWPRRASAKIGRTHGSASCSVPWNTTVIQNALRGARARRSSAAVHERRRPAGEDRELGRGRARDLGDDPHRFGRAFERHRHVAGPQRPDRLEVELELGDDAEVAAAAAQGPQQLRVAALAGGTTSSRRP